CAVCGYDLGFEGHAKLAHHVDGMAHHVPVTLAAHDNADLRFFHCKPLCAKRHFTVRTSADVPRSGLLESKRLLKDERHPVAAQGLAMRLPEEIPMFDVARHAPCPAQTSLRHH